VLRASVLSDSLGGLFNCMSVGDRRAVDCQPAEDEVNARSLPYLRLPPGLPLFLAPGAPSRTAVAPLGVVFSCRATAAPVLVAGLEVGGGDGDPPISSTSRGQTGLLPLAVPTPPMPWVRQPTPGSVFHSPLSILGRVRAGVPCPDPARLWNVACWPEHCVASASLRCSLVAA
jgi:hypothetical protein